MVTNTCFIDPERPKIAKTAQTGRPNRTRKSNQRVGGTDKHRDRTDRKDRQKERQRHVQETRPIRADEGDGREVPQVNGGSLHTARLRPLAYEGGRSPEAFATAWEVSNKSGGSQASLSLPASVRRGVSALQGSRHLLPGGPPPRPLPSGERAAKDTGCTTFPSTTPLPTPPGSRRCRSPRPHRMGGDSVTKLTEDSLDQLCQSGSGRLW